MGSAQVYFVLILIPVLITRENTQSQSLPLDAQGWVAREGELSFGDAFREQGGGEASVPGCRACLGNRNLGWRYGEPVVHATVQLTDQGSFLGL